MGFLKDQIEPLLYPAYLLVLYQVAPVMAYSLRFSSAAGSL
ncbi:unnamed protein product [Strongylus vulgaris]|uniref:Uncharacterized protein n=1 Tax=Strongylus vulgaris TaxID=40348 RepID=A0A3P7K004_STRVU|nr:unnamed protein product [Strongylus vulgaris]